MKEFFYILIAFFAVVGFYYLSVTLIRRFDKSYKIRCRGTYLYIPLGDNDQTIVSFDELVKKEKLIVIVRSEREREDVINDLIERFGTVYKYKFI